MANNLYQPFMIFVQEIIRVVFIIPNLNIYFLAILLNKFVLKVSHRLHILKSVITILTWILNFTCLQDHLNWLLNHL